MRTCALDFGGLVCTFHDASYEPLSYKLIYKSPPDDSNDLAGRQKQPIFTAVFLEAIFESWQHVQQAGRLQNFVKPADLTVVGPLKAQVLQAV